MAGRWPAAAPSPSRTPSPPTSRTSAARSTPTTRSSASTTSPPARAYVFDTSPTALAKIAGFGDYYANYRYGPGVFKVDYALDGPVPWTAKEARTAYTVQIGADSKEIDTALRAASRENRAPTGRS